MNQTVNTLPANAVWKHYNHAGEAAHFYHANGFPVGVYNPLVTRLSQSYNLSTLAWRATWPGTGKPPGRRDWQIYADDLIAFIEHNYNEPIIGMGHSMGATCTVLAAEKRPDLFKSLVLIEPAMVSKPLALLVRLLPKAIMNITEPAKSTLNKQEYWDSREEFLAYCKEVRGYKRFNDEAFQAMAQYGVVDTDDGRFQLGFPKVWEAHNYTQPPNILANIERLKMPCLAIRGKPSVFFTEAMWKEWQARCPNTIFKEDLEFGHLLPLENPGGCSELIRDGLQSLKG